MRTPPSPRQHRLPRWPGSACGLWPWGVTTASPRAGLEVFSWGGNSCGQLVHGDKLTKPAPALVEGLEGACGIAAATKHSLAVTQSGAVFSWGRSFQREAQGCLRLILVEGFGGVRVRRVCPGVSEAVAIGEAGEHFS